MARAYYTFKSLFTFTGRFLGFGAMTAAAVFGFVVPVSAQAQSGREVNRNIRAADFLNTFGANVHFNENNYKNVQAIADALNIIGFSRVRSQCTSEEEVSDWKDLERRARIYFPAGLKADVLIIGYLNVPNTTFRAQQDLVTRLGKMVESIEGPNEINNHDVGNGTHGPSAASDVTDQWPANYVAWARALSTWKQNTPALANVKLFAPSIASGDPADYARLPNVSHYVDAGNLHFYAGDGRQPSNFGGGNFAAIYDWYRAAATPNKPVTVTEWGQTTASKPGQAGCDNRTQAKYVLNQMFDVTARGVERAYVYQLMDDTPDGDPTGNGGTESHFGLFDYRWGVKPAAQALANVKNLLRDSTVRFTSKVPAYHVRGLSQAGAAGSSLTISKSDGSTFVIVWNEPPIWDSKANTEIAPPVDHVKVTFGGPYNYRVYDPLIGLKPIALGQISEVGISLTGSPLMIHLLPKSP